MLEFIIGRAGSGKTYYCLDEILELNRNQQRVIMILPDQMTHSVEMMLLERIKSFSGIYLCGIRKFAEQIISEQGGLQLPRINAVGRSVLLKKVMNELPSEQIKYYGRAAKRRGFTEKLTEVLQELRAYKLTPEILVSTAEKISDDDLSNKLRDFSLFSTKFSEAMENRNTTYEDILDSIPDRLQNSEFLHDSEAFIDGFVFFNPQEKSIVKEILKNARNVHVTLIMDPEEEFSYNTHVPEGIFYRSYVTFNWLKKTAEELEIDTKTIKFFDYQRSQKRDLLYLERILRDPITEFYKNDSDSITIFAGDDRYNEIELVAGDILRLCRDKGFRFKEISILVRDFSAYDDIIPHVFDEAGISYFYDKKSRLSLHPISALIKSSLSTIKTWKFDSIFSCLSTGFFGIDEKEINDLENYILAVSDGGNIKHLIATGSLEEKFIKPLSTLQKNLQGRSIDRKVKALYQFLTDLNVDSTLEHWVNDASKEKSKNEHKLAWAWTMELLDQLIALDIDDISQRDFEDMLTEGISTITYSTIPAKEDEVSIESFDLNSAMNKRAVYVIGFDDQNYPRKVYKETLLNDSDRMILNENGIEINPGTESQALNEDYLIYRGLTTPRERLVLSYSKLSIESGAIKPSLILNEIKRIFPKIKPIDPMRLLLPKSYERLGVVFKQIKDGRTVPEFWFDVYNNALENDKDLELILTGLTYRADMKNIPKNLAGKIFTKEGKIVGSVTEFEMFSQCPFKHFAKYGLKLEPRKEYEFKPIDLGTLLHNVLKKYGEGLKNRSEKWKDQDEQSILEEVSRIIDEITPTILQGKYQLERIKRIAMKNVQRLIEFDKVSPFEPTLYEEEFSLEKDDITIEGKIDRVDFSNDGKYFLVLDYKTGDTDLEDRRIYWGLQLQLLTYVLAIINAFEDKNNVAGAVYCILRMSNIQSYDQEPTDNDLAENVKAKGKMHGWLLESEKNDSLVQSKMIMISKKSDKKKTIRSSQEFKDWLEHVEKTLEDIGKRIISGEIQPSPYKIGDEEACTYCEYRDICGFDTNIPGYKYRDFSESDDLHDDENSTD